LDELLGSDCAPFEAKAKQLDGLNACVIVTCRTMHWEERKGWLGWGGLTEVELVPFKHRQQREFTGKFFERQPDLAQNMERLLHVNLAMRHACTTPRLLTFACLLHEDGKVDENTSYATLYAQIGRMMFSGRWRGIKPDWAGSQVKEENCWHFFEDIAWRLFAKAPHLNLFTLDDWRQAAGQATENGVVAPLEATALLEELEYVGIIVPAGFDEQRADLCWTFAHRTFLELLVARALSRMEQQKRMAEAKQHFEFIPERPTSKGLEVPYGKNLLFTGRVEVLDDLRRTLEEHRTVALSGLGGIGKTQIAIEYAHRYGDEYESVLWMNCEALISNFISLADKLNLPMGSEKDQAGAVRDWLESHSGWLLVMDNANDLSLAREYIPSKVRGHILLTTRAQATGPIAHCLEIKEMRPEESALFLLRRAKVITKEKQLYAASDVDVTLAKEISEEMGHLPLALDQAGAYIEETKSNGCGFFLTTRKCQKMAISPRFDHSSVGSPW
jgi:hypothetical protein